MRLTSNLTLCYYSGGTVLYVREANRVSVTFRYPADELTIITAKFNALAVERFVGIEEDDGIENSQMLVKKLNANQKN